MTLVILRYNVIVAGGGISGLCAGAKLSEAGIPFTIFEAGQDFCISFLACPRRVRRKEKPLLELKGNGSYM